MSIPKPNGPFPVGTIDIMTKVLSLPTKLSCPFLLLDEKVNLGTFVRLYYPTDPTLVKDHVTTNALPNDEPGLYAKGMLKAMKMGWLTFLFRGFLQKISQHSYMDAPIISDQTLLETQKYVNDKPALPLVIFSHGLLGFRTMYSSFCTDLASHGYIVAAVEHRDGSASPTYFRHPETDESVEVPYAVCSTQENGDEKSKSIRNLQVKRRAEEISKLLDLLVTLNNDPESIKNCLPSKFDLTSLKGRIDVEEPLIIGHSFGGATTLNIIHKDDRFKCAVVLDPWFLPLPKEVYEKDKGYKKPTIHVFTERFNWKKNIENCQNYVKSLPEDYAEIITMKNAVHVDQSDASGMTPHFIQRLYRIPHRDYEGGINLHRKVHLDFFSKYFQQKAYPIKLLSDGYQLPNEFFHGMRVFGEPTEEDRKDDSAKS